MTRYSLTLVLFGASLLVVGCGSSSSTSSSKKDAAPALPDGNPVAADGPNVLHPDAILDLAPVTSPDGPLVTPDSAADSLLVKADVGPIVTPDAAADSLPVAADTAIDQASVQLDTGPVATVDAAADSLADAAEDGAAADDSGAETDSLPVTCFRFVGGVVVADLTLTKACSPYTISDFIEVNDGAVLTIEPGVTLAFEGGLGLDVGASSVGKLVAVGTAQNPIIFTSSSNPPLPGDWRAIHLWDGTMAGTQIAYAKLDYCGADRNGCIVGDGVQANLVTLDHLTIGHVGPDSNGILEYDTYSNFIITNSIFSDIASDRYAISVQAPSLAGIGTTNTFIGGAMIEVSGGTISATTSWADPGTTIAVTDNLFVEGPDSPVLTLGPGMTFAFDTSLEFAVGFAFPGKLVVAGTSANRVVITSLAAKPGQGDWVGVTVWENGSAQVSYADISYAGSDSTAGGDLILRSGNSTSHLSADHSSFTYSQGYGIYLDCADPTVTPVATATIDASNTYAHNDSDMTDVNDQGHNVGPGLNCPPNHRLPSAKLAPRGRTR